MSTVRRTAKNSPELQEAIRKLVGLPATASREEVDARVAAPPAGTPLHTSMKKETLALGEAAGALAAGRRAHWERAADRDLASVTGALAMHVEMHATPEVAERAQRTLGDAAATASAKTRLRAYADAIQPEAAPEPVVTPTPTPAPTPDVPAPPAAGEDIDPKLQAAHDELHDAMVARQKYGPGDPRAQLSAETAAILSPPPEKHVVDFGTKGEMTYDKAAGKVLYEGLPTKLSDRGTRQVYSEEGWMDVQQFEALGLTADDSRLALAAGRFIPSVARNINGTGPSFIQVPK